MPERAFLTETWDDDWFHGLSKDQRYLFIYLWTNGRCNQAGVYHMNLATMAFETKFTEGELPELLKSLSPKVEWYPEPNYIWVRNFIKRQAEGPPGFPGGTGVLGTADGRLFGGGHPPGIAAWSIPRRRILARCRRWR